jgi:hypothetical protein
MSTNRFLFLIVLITLLFIVPVSAELRIQRTDDGKTLISNGSCWIEWDPIANHVVGDRFYINGTTNLTVGTVLGYELVPGVYNVQKNYIPKPPLAIGEAVVKPGNTSINTISIFIKNTENPSDNYYFFHFGVLSSIVPVEFDAFNGTCGLDRGFLLSEKRDNNTTYDTIIKPTPSPLPLIFTVMALIVSLCVFLIIQQNKKNTDDSGD